MTSVFRLSHVISYTLWKRNAKSLEYPFNLVNYITRKSGFCDIDAEIQLPKLSMYYKTRNIKRVATWVYIVRTIDTFVIHR